MRLLAFVVNFTLVSQSLWSQVDSEEVVLEPAVGHAVGAPSLLLLLSCQCHVMSEYGSCLALR